MTRFLRLKGIALALVFSGLFASEAQAQFSPTEFGDPNSLLSDNVVKQFVTQLGFGADHRPYQPATPLGTAIGIDLGVEMTLFYITDDFRQALDESGYSAASLPPSLPLPRIHLHKGVSERTDIGLSVFAYTQYLVAGGNIKVAFLTPEEGIWGAFRISYNYTTVDLAAVHTVTPQVLFSRELHFADPYIGLGLQYAWGKVSVPLSQFVTPPEGFSASDLGSATKSSSAVGMLAFLGVALKLGPTGLKLTLDGSYSTASTHSVGMKFGLAF